MNFQYQGKSRFLLPNLLQRSAIWRWLTHLALPLLAWKSKKIHWRRTYKRPVELLSQQFLTVRRYWDRAMLKRTQAKERGNVEADGYENSQAEQTMMP